MRVLLLYSSQHGTTYKIVSKIKSFLHTKVTLTFANVKVLESVTSLNAQDVILFCTPTYGCEELHKDMEEFILKTILQNKKFTIIETGNYYGYEDFTFGAKKILQNYLLQNNCVEFCECLSLDTYPRVDWSQLEHWLNYFDTYVR